MSVDERERKRVGSRTREGRNKRYSKKLKISSVLRHSLGHMVTGIYHIRSQFLTRWGHISRDSGGYNHSLLKIQWIDGRDEGTEGDRRPDRSWGKKESVRPLTFSACLTKGKRPQYLRVVSTHGVYSKDLVGPHKSYKAEPFRDFPFFYCFFFLFFLHIPLFAARML